MAEINICAAKLDLGPAVDGVWTEVYPGWELLIASTMTADYERALSDARAPYLDLIEAGKATPEMLDDMQKVAVSKAIVRGSRGLDAQSYGEAGEFSSEWMLGVLRDPAFHHIWARVRVASRREEVYRAKVAAVAAKN